MKQTLLARMLTGPNGGVSSKRGVMFAVLFVFLGGYIATFFGAHPLDVIQDQLFTVLLAAITAVFGDNIVKANKEINMKKADQPEVNVNVTKPENADITNVSVPDKIATK